MRVSLHPQCTYVSVGTEHVSQIIKTNILKQNKKQQVKQKNKHYVSKKKNISTIITTNILIK